MAEGKRTAGTADAHEMAMGRFQLMTNQIDVGCIPNYPQYEVGHPSIPRHPRDFDLLPPTRSKERKIEISKPGAYVNGRKDGVHSMPSEGESLSPLRIQIGAINSGRDIGLFVRNPRRDHRPRSNWGELMESALKP